MAGAWQERPGQVLGSVSGNLRPEQSFPFGENGLFPSSPCGVGRARLHAGATWEDGHTRAETRIGDTAVLPTSPYRACDRGGAEGSRSGHGAGVSGSPLRVGKSRLQVREVTSNGRPPGPREPTPAAPAGAAKTPKSPPRSTSASPATRASSAARRACTAGRPRGLQLRTAGPLLPQGPRERRGPPRRPGASPVDDELVVGGRLVTHGAQPSGLLLVHLEVEDGVEALQVRAGLRPAGHRQPHLHQLRGARGWREWPPQRRRTAGRWGQRTRAPGLTGQMRETRTPVVAISLSGSRRSFSLTADKRVVDVRRDRGVCGVGAKRQIFQPPSALGKAAASTLSPSISGGRQSAHGDPNSHRPGRRDACFGSRAQGCGVPCESSQGSSWGVARQQGTLTRQAHPAAHRHSPRASCERKMEANSRLQGCPLGLHIPREPSLSTWQKGRRAARSRTVLAALCTTCGARTRGPPPEHSQIWQGRARAHEHGFLGDQSYLSDLGKAGRCLKPKASWQMPTTTHKAPFSTVNTGLEEKLEGKACRANPGEGPQRACSSPPPDPFRLALPLFCSQWEWGGWPRDPRRLSRDGPRSCPSFLRSSPAALLQKLLLPSHTGLGGPAQARPQPTPLTHLCEFPPHARLSG